MIISDRQYKTAKQQLSMLNASLCASNKPNVPALISEAGRAQILELITEIQASIKEYEKLKNLI